MFSQSNHKSLVITGNLMQWNIKITRIKWSLAKNPDSWWHRHTSLKLFLAAAHGSKNNRNVKIRFISGIINRHGIRAHKGNVLLAAC
jgi:hypothetical protein